MDGMAQETQIQLYKENVDDWVKDDRSLPIMPTATHDGNIISIYSDMPIENTSSNVLYEILVYKKWLFLPQLLVNPSLDGIYIPF